MRVCYLDMVSTEAPQHRAEPWFPHAARVALTVEEDRQPIQTICALVLPEMVWPTDDVWIIRYGGLPDWEQALAVGAVADMVSAALEGVHMMVAHNWQFHREVMQALMFDAAGAAWMPTPFCDTMREAAAACAIPSKSGRGYKSPSLAEAYLHFAGKPLEPIEGMAWRQAALRQINALRAVYWGMEGWGKPTGIVA